MQFSVLAVRTGSRLDLLPTTSGMVIPEQPRCPMSVELRRVKLQNFASCAAAAHGARDSHQSVIVHGPDGPAGRARRL